MEKHGEVQRAFITGGTGFVGRHLARRLLDEGWKVGLLVRSDEFKQKAWEGGSAYEYDGSTESVIAAVSQENPAIVFHLASLFLASHNASQVSPLISSNVLLGAQLLEAMKVCGCKKLVNVGTSWQHYLGGDYDPVCLYAATKQAFEAILAYYANAEAIAAITLKLFDTYGPEDPRPKLITKLREAMIANRPLEMSPGQQLISLVYISDVVNAFVQSAGRLLGSSISGLESYVVDADQPVALQDLVHSLEHVCSKKVPVRWGALPYRSREVMQPYRGGKRLPGWLPQVTLEEGLRLTMAGAVLCGQL